MAEHPSRLALDEWLGGLAAPGRVESLAAHVAACGQCQTLTDELKRAREVSLGSPRASAVLARLEARRRQEAERTERGRWRWSVPMLAALAASLVIVVVVPRMRGAETVRLKGTVAVRVLSEQGEPVGTAQAGERVQLAVGTGPYRQVLVLAVDEAGEVTPLWPPSASHSGEVEPGAQVPLRPSFEVTAGSTSLLAFFSDAPLDSEEARAVVAERVARAKARGERALDVEPPEGLGRARAHTVLRVLP